MSHLEALHVILACQIITTLSATIALDRSHDTFWGIWRIEGDVEYFDSTSNLRQPRGLKYLPHYFNYDKLGLKSERGIWGIFPKDKNRCALFDDDYDDLFKESISMDKAKKKKDTCGDRSNSVFFHFTPSSLRVEQVKVRFASGGENATIRVLRGGGKEEMLTMKLKARTTDTVGWAEFSTEIHGQMMTLEANVHGLGDYILIDTITVFIPDKFSGHGLDDDDDDDEPPTQTNVEPSRHDENSTNHSKLHINITSSKRRVATTTTPTPTCPTASTTMSITPTDDFTTTYPTGSTPEPRPSPVKNGQEGLLVPFALKTFLVFFHLCNFL